MIKHVVIGSKKVQLDQNKVLGTGGEATVVRCDNRAVKIYHNPNDKRVAKLKAFCNAHLKLPSNVCAPQDLVYNPTGEVVGFTMPLIPAGREVVQQLSRKSFRKSNPACNSTFITDLFVHSYKTTEALHSDNIVVGDYSDLNFLFDVLNPLMLFIDVDSYQFANHRSLKPTEIWETNKISHFLPV